MLGMLIWIFIIGAVIFFIFAQKMSAITKVNEEWMQAAGKLKLAFSKANGILDTPRISGHVDDLPVKVYVQLEKKGGHVVPFTVYSISLPEKFDLDGFLSDMEDSVAAGVEKLAFRSGHPLIDKLLAANGFNSKTVKSLLEKARAEFIAKFTRMYPGLIIAENEIRCKFEGVDESGETIRGRINQLIILAKGLRGGTLGDGVETFGKLLAAEAGKPSEATHSVNAAPRPGKTPETSHVPSGSHIPAENVKPVASQTPLANQTPAANFKPLANQISTVSSKPVANQMPTVSSKPVASQTPTESHIPILSSKPVASQMPTVSKAPSMSPIPIGSHTPSALQATPAPAKEPLVQVQEQRQPGICGTDQEELAKALFSASLPGQSEKTLFEAVKGKAVSWSGVLKSSNEYGVDFDFGGGEGTKGIFEICEITGSFSMKTKVKAVVQFPKGMGAELKGRYGQTVSFSGSLLKFESFAKEIYVSGGKLS